MPPGSDHPPPSSDAAPGRWDNRPKRHWASRLIIGSVVAVSGFGLSIVLLIAVALAVAYPNLPDVSDLTDYRPKLPLRVFTADGVLIGEFGEERRHLTPIASMPAVMKNAVLAIEDARFYQHHGVDYIGVLRAGLANLGRFKSQGASTITMQVARNVYLSSEKTYTRKIYELLLTFKLEHLLTKDQILEIYMNQIFLGNRSYGFAAASETYFGKPLQFVTVAEAAMLAGLPKAPSAYNPISNPKRARVRQQHIIDRMLENGFITAEQAKAAKAETLKIRSSSDPARLHAEFVAENVRQLVFSQYGEETYTRGLNVHTSLRSIEQEAAYRALRKGIMDYERRQVFRGPEGFVELPADPKEWDDAVDDALAEHPDNGDVIAAVVVEASAKQVIVLRPSGDRIEITGAGLRPAQSGLSDKAAPAVRIRKGSIIRIMTLPDGTWSITQLPEVEGALVALDPRTGAIRALVGGFDYAKNKFNHVTQAWRQPGSAFKPFIYSAALEKGFTPSTVVNDEPLFFDAGVTGGQPWEPKNYDGKFEGPMPLHIALAKSKNMVSIRVLQSVGAQNAQDWITRFGFDAERHPPYLTMALGAGSVTVMQMATGYAVFANGGFRVNPWLISRISDQKGRVLFEGTPPKLDDNQRAIEARNAFVMNRLLQEVTRSGTAARAQGTLKRADLYGKTGTTNDSIDNWFAGFQPSIVSVVWIGYDNPRSLGESETGGRLSLPVWINFMETALKGVPVMEPGVPEGLVSAGGEWVFDELAGGGVRQIAPQATAAPEPKEPAKNPSGADERNRILDLFRN